MLSELDGWCFKNQEVPWCVMELGYKEHGDMPREHDFQDTARGAIYCRRCGYVLQGHITTPPREVF